MTSKIDVSLGSRTYPIYIEHGLLRNSNVLSKTVLSKQVVIISDSTVAKLYLETVKENLHDKQCAEFILAPGEESKTLQNFDRIISFMLEEKINRTATIIALGGGVVGDIAGFVAASYQRGINYLQIPTTLLAQVDSSVGGKTAVNHPLGKNMIGAFYQPMAVLADTSTLETLEKRDFNAGIAEVIKYGLIKDKDFFTWIVKNLSLILSYNKNALRHIVKKSCQNKAAIVEMDERENGIRAILNLGHTFGHAIETFEGYGSWLHGEAISAGMSMAAHMSKRLGYINDIDARAIDNLLTKCDLPIKPPKNMTPEDFLNVMSRDKKNTSEKIRLILLQSIGEAFVTSDYPKDTLISIIKDSNNRLKG